MPYKSIKDLPSTVRGKYGTAGQKTFLTVFNKVLQSTGDEGEAFGTAHKMAKKTEAEKQR